MGRRMEAGQDYQMLVPRPQTLARNVCCRRHGVAQPADQPDSHLAACEHEHGQWIGRRSDSRAARNSHSNSHSNSNSNSNSNEHGNDNSNDSDNDNDIGNDNDNDNNKMTLWWRRCALVNHV